MWRYGRRLENDLARWRDAGWVTPEGDAAIRAEIAAARLPFGLSGALAVLGVVLLGFATMSFVAANWQEMSKLARLLLLALLLVGAYGAGGMLLERRMTGFGHAALLFGVAVFGASIMLIAQMYHIEGNPPDALLTWMLGALGTGVLVGSNPSLGAAMLLAGLWSGWETSQTMAVHLGFLPAWAAITAAMVWREWRAGLMLSAVAIASWTIALGYLLNGGHAHEFVVLIGLLVAGCGLVLAYSGKAFPAEPALLIGTGMAIAFAGLFALQFIERPPLGALTLLAVLTLGALLAAIVWGSRKGYGSILWLGYAGFSIEVLGIYFKTIGTLMGSSLFFLLTGLVVLALAALAWQLHERTGASVTGAGR